MTTSGVLKPHCGRADGEFSTIIAIGRLPSASTLKFDSPVRGFVGAGAAVCDVSGAVSVSYSGVSLPQAEKAVTKSARLIAAAVIFVKKVLFMVSSSF